MRKSSYLAACVAVALGVAIGLSGCAPAVHPQGAAGTAHSPAVRSASPRPMPASTAAALGPLPANALFRITATVTEPSGASADLVQTVFAPAAPTVSDTALLNAQCNQSGQPTWQSAYPAPLFLTTTITATLHPGSAPWPASDQVAAFFLGATSAYSGGYTEAQADCAPGYIEIPGTIHGVAAVDSANPAKGPGGWANELGEYGFDGPGNDPTAADESGTGVVKGCHIEASATAKAASTVVAGWLAQPFNPQAGCIFQGTSTP